MKVDSPKYSGCNWDRGERSRLLAKQSVGDFGDGKVEAARLEAHRHPRHLQFSTATSARNSHEQKKFERKKMQKICDQQGNRTPVTSTRLGSFTVGYGGGGKCEGSGGGCWGVGTDWTLGSLTPPPVQVVSERAGSSVVGAG